MESVQSEGEPVRTNLKSFDDEKPAPTALPLRFDSPPEFGDVVKLGPRALPEYRQRLAIVTKVAEAHCTVVVLDQTSRFGCGECWPNLSDVEPVHTVLRLGSQVVVQGMTGAKTSPLNGCAGCIVAHPREGHPSFVCKASYPDPVLTVCVQLGHQMVIIEPRHLVPYEGYSKKVLLSLSNQLAAMESSGPPGGKNFQETMPAVRQESTFSSNGTSVPDVALSQSQDGSARNTGASLSMTMLQVGALRICGTSRVCGTSRARGTARVCGLGEYCGIM